MLTASIVNKILHVPTVKMKEVAGQDQCYLYVDAVRTLFDLDTNEGGEEPAAGDEPPAAAPTAGDADEPPAADEPAAVSRRPPSRRPPPPEAPSITCAAPGRRTHEQPP